MLLAAPSPQASTPMTTVLVIASDPALSSAWTEAARAAGFGVRRSPSILPAIDVLSEESIDGILLDARSEETLVLFATLSAYRPMPTTMIVSDLEHPIACRARAAHLRPSAKSPRALVQLLGQLLDVRSIASPTNLPMRLPSVAAKWTFRGSADDGEVRDGETDPDGWDFSSPA